MLKSDIYDPKDDTFPLFIECKNGYGFTVSGMFNGTSPVFGFYKTAETNCNESHLSSKHSSPPIPVLVFRGGDFIDDMVMFDYTRHSDRLRRINDGECVVLQAYGRFTICKLSDFLLHFRVNDLVQKSNNKRTHEVIDEDDGEC